VSAPAGERIQAIGMAIALDDRWQRHMRGAPQPWITQQLYAELLTGRTRPPSERELARANASSGDDEGVTFMVLHYQQRNTDMSDPQAVAVLSAGLTAMRLAHAGHRVREIFQEAWQDEQAYMHSIGMVQRSTHATAIGDADPPELPELFGLSRAEALRKLPGFQIREIFEHSAPIFRFRGAEQRLLRRALFDEPDELIASLLSVSPHTLKKLWRSIYERVEDSFPSLLADAAALNAEGVRGPEKRRTLMRYLRQHPEEMRPYAASGVVTARQAHRETG
jgi:DNA-binding CsgD family transcriptional regulator